VSPARRRPERLGPDRLRGGEDLLTDRRVNRVSQRETNPWLVAPEREIVAPPGRVRTGRDVLVQGALREMLEREFQHVQMVLGVALRRSRAAGARREPVATAILPGQANESALPGDLHAKHYRRSG
jgi:hypothetical protein